MTATTTNDAGDTSIDVSSSQNENERPPPRPYRTALSSTSSTLDETAMQEPLWVIQLQSKWGERLTVPELQSDSQAYRQKHGWKGRDYIHDIDAPVRIFDYFVRYGDGSGLESVERGGIGTTLTGIVHYTPRAESHAGYCHGGTMCSVFDDAIGWIAFCVTGVCKPWSGYTVQVNTNLLRPIAVGSVLLIQATISAIERRKVSVSVRLVDPTDGDSETAVVHAKGEGLVVLNRGVLPLTNRESMDSWPSTTT